MTSGSPTDSQQRPPRSRLTPHAALGWLGSLSIDIRALAVLDADGAVLAGDTELAQQSGNEGVIVARSGQHAIVANVGPKALQRLVRADLQAAVEALEPR
jgi:hypothetical protein